LNLSISHFLIFLHYILIKKLITALTLKKYKTINYDTKGRSESITFDLSN
jgi:hypothetical protein